MEQDKSSESKYIQQHLANERTYLAWVRTSIAIIGIGFLASSLHFTSIKAASIFADRTAVLVSLLSLTAGLTLLFFAAVNYFKNRRRINNQTFTSANRFIIVATAVIFIIFIWLFIYLIGIIL
ncbi:DUF202 domain-containing protein [Mesobacillus harenae]|uniref:DUF202 domain-containing protein n=1 Tax=Mesobacillus harenae TaxID=2213203 RepID=UPI001580F7F7